MDAWWRALNQVAMAAARWLASGERWNKLSGEDTGTNYLARTPADAKGRRNRSTVESSRQWRWGHRGSSRDGGGDIVDRAKRRKGRREST
jgi:hypothetical protein